MYGSHRFNYYHILLGFVVLWSGCQSGKILIDGRIDNEDTILDRIVIVPDIQYYTNNPERLKYLESISSFIKDSDVPVSTCLQVGDITYQNTEEQWENAYSFFFSRIPDNINLIYCLGNHDYGKNGRSVSRKSNIPKVLEPVKDLECDNTVYENYVRFIKVGGKQYAVLVLEFATRNISLEWANRVIRMNPETNIIILTHAFLNNQGLLFDAFDLDCDNSGSPKEYTMGREYIYDSKEVFETIVKDNPNVRMIICGHCVSKHYIEVLSLKNAEGKDVFCLMVNYQHYREGGRGYIGILDCLEDGFLLKSYSTYESKDGGIYIPLVEH